MRTTKNDAPPRHAHPCDEPVAGLASKGRARVSAQRALTSLRTTNVDFSTRRRRIAAAPPESAVLLPGGGASVDRNPYAVLGAHISPNVLACRRGPPRRTRSVRTRRTAPVRTAELRLPFSRQGAPRRTRSVRTRRAMSAGPLFKVSAAASWRQNGVSRSAASIC